MRVKLLIVVLGAAFLVVSGFRFGKLPYTPGAMFSDAVTSHLPAAQYFRVSVVDKHTFPVWRETIMAGQPFAADPLNKTAYPLQWLVLLFSPIDHLDLMIALHLLIAGAGIWVWARSLGLSEWAAGISAVAYALSPRAVGHTGAGHLDLLYALAWFPLLMWSVQRLLQVDSLDKPPGVFLERVLLVALFGSMILLADVRLSLFAYTLAGAFALYEAIRLKRLRRLWRFAPAALLIVLLTLSLTLPLWGWRPYLSRAAMTPGDAGIFSLQRAHWIGLLLPARGGNIETLTYVGLPVLVLAVIGTLAARRWFWAAAAGIAALYALGINAPFWTLLVKLIPVLLWFRVPSRAWFVVALIAPLLAGYGAQWLIDHRSRVSSLIAFAGMVTAALIGGFVAVTLTSLNGWSILVGGGGIGAILLLAKTGRLRGERLAFALVVVVFADLAIHGVNWLEWRPQTAWLPQEQVQLAERLNELGAYRVYSPTYSLQQQVAEDYHLRIFGGVDPFQLSGIAAAVEQGSGISAQGYSVVLPPLTGVQGDDLATANRDAVPNTTILGQWGVTHVVSAYPLNLPMLEKVDQIGDAIIYANTDTVLTADADAFPAWASNQQDLLPDAATVAALNQLTLTAALFSGAALLITLALVTGVILMKVRH